MCAMTPSPLQVWGTKPSTTKLMAFEVQDWTHEGEDVFVDVRAKATPDRTREAVLENRRCVATKGRPEDRPSGEPKRRPKGSKGTPSRCHRGPFVRKSLKGRPKSRKNIMKQPATIKPSGPPPPTPGPPEAFAMLQRFRVNESEPR